MKKTAGIVSLVLAVFFFLCGYLGMPVQGLAQEEGEPMVYAGHWDDLAGVVTPFPDDKFIVFGDNNGLYAISTECTHNGCSLPFKQDLNTFMCPCHGSSFDRNGKVLSGPAEKNLPWYSMKVDGDGKVWVDKTKTVGHGARFTKPVADESSLVNKKKEG